MTSRAEIKGKISMDSDVEVGFRRADAEAQRYLGKMQSMAGAVGGIFTAGAVASWVRNTAQWADNITQFASNLRIGTADVLAFERIAKLSNLSLDQFQMLLGKTSDLQNDVASGLNGAREKLGALNISTQEAVSLDLPGLLIRIGEEAARSGREINVLGDLFGSKLGVKATEALRNLKDTFPDIRREMESQAKAVEDAAEAQAEMDTWGQRMMLAGAKGMQVVRMGIDLFGRQAGTKFLNTDSKTHESFTDSATAILTEGLDKDLAEQLAHIQRVYDLRREVAASEQRDQLDEMNRLRDEAHKKALEQEQKFVGEMIKKAADLAKAQEEAAHQAETDAMRRAQARTAAGIAHERREREADRQVAQQFFQPQSMSDTLGSLGAGGSQTTAELGQLSELRRISVALARLIRVSESTEMNTRDLNPFTTENP